MATDLETSLDRPKAEDQCRIGFQPVSGQATLHPPPRFIRQTSNRHSLTCTKKTGWKLLEAYSTIRPSPVRAGAVAIKMGHRRGGPAWRGTLAPL
jgi:hypothetical protein